jgi:hypothetical protein
VNDLFLLGQVVNYGLAFFLQSDRVADQLQVLECKSGRLQLHDVQCQHGQQLNVYDVGLLEFVLFPFLYLFFNLLDGLLLV